MLKIISFEGVDGSGKTTLAQELFDKCIEKRIKVAYFRDPGSTPIGEAIRKIVKDASISRDPEVELMLYSAARLQMIKTDIVPAFLEGNLIILDRFFDSSAAYQCYAKGVPIEKLRGINKLFRIEKFTPDLTFFIDKKPSLCNVSDKSKFDTFDLDRELQEKVYNGYLKLIMRSEFDRFVILPSGASWNTLGDRVASEVFSRL